MREEIVEFGPDLEDLGWAVFGEDFGGDGA